MILCNDHDHYYYDYYYDIEVDDKDNDDDDDDENCDDCKDNDAGNDDGYDDGDDKDNDDDLFAKLLAPHKKSQLALGLPQYQNQPKTTHQENHQNQQNHHRQQQNHQHNKTISLSLSPTSIPPSPWPVLLRAPGKFCLLFVLPLFFFMYIVCTHICCLFPSISCFPQFVWHFPLFFLSGFLLKKTIFSTFDLQSFAG